MSRSTHNICFSNELEKTVTELSQNTSSWHILQSLNEDHSFSPGLLAISTINTAQPYITITCAEKHGQKTFQQTLWDLAF